MALPDISRVAIIGCGVFGLSTGLALSKRYPNSKITLLDRHEPPVPDGTSTDTTRVIRADYHDELYANLAFESQQSIKADPDLNPFYHRSGMIFANGGPGHDHSDLWEKEYQHAKAFEKERIDRGEFGPEGYVRDLFSHEKVFQRVNGDCHSPSPEGAKLWNQAYCNEDIAFVEATRCMKAYYEKCKRESNIEFLFGDPVKNIIFGGNAAKGLLLESGAKIDAELVVVAAGPWSNRLVDLRERIIATGHEVAWLKLSPEDAERYKNMPISTNFTTGFNSFPPLDGEIKVLRRSPGYLRTVNLQNPMTGADDYAVSLPPDTPYSIPEEAEVALRENLAEIFPTLADQPFARTKLCWFTNTPTSDFLIDLHPTVQNLVVVTGGSAHGWKFLCVLGDKVVDMLEGKLRADLRERWRFRDLSKPAPDMQGAPKAKGVRKELNV